jgi:hypothetical protein
MNLQRHLSKKALRMFDNARSNREGWALFNDGELQRLDEGPIFRNNQDFGHPLFESDARAIEYVKWRADLGSTYHKRAYALHCKWQANRRLGV